MSSDQAFYQFKDCCLTGRLLAGKPQGQMFEASSASPLSYYKAPVSPTTSTNSKPKVAIVLLYDIFGFNLDNPKILCDQYAEQLRVSYPDGELDVFAPDYVYPMSVPESALRPMLADIPNQAAIEAKEGKGVGFFAKVGQYLEMISYIPQMRFMRKSVTVPRTEAFLKQLRAEGYEKIGIIGYCLGGSQSIYIASQPSSCTPGQPPLVDTAIICHPGPNELKDVEKFTIPTAWVCAEEDSSFGDERREKVREILERKKAEGIDYEMRVFKGTVHGFACRPAVEYPEVKQAFNDSGVMSREWFKKHLLS